VFFILLYIYVICETGFLKFLIVIQTHICPSTEIAIRTSRPIIITNILLNSGFRQEQKSLLRHSTDVSYFVLYAGLMENKQVQELFSFRKSWISNLFCNNNNIKPYGKVLEVYSSL